MMFSETKPLKSSSDGPSPSKNREESHPNHSNNMFPKSTGMDKLILLAGLISKLRSRRLAVGGPPGGGVVQADTEDRSAQLPLFPRVNSLSLAFPVLQALLGTWLRVYRREGLAGSLCHKALSAVPGGHAQVSSASCGFPVGSSPGKRSDPPSL